MSSLLGSTTKSKAKNKVILLNQLHIYGVIAAKIIAATIILSMAMWSFIRMPDPEVHLTRLTVDAVNSTIEAQRSNLIHFGITLHNPDRYKSVKYENLVLRITFPYFYNGVYGELINYNNNNKSLIQGPGETTYLANHVLNCTYIGWDPKKLMTVKTYKKSLYFRFIMEISLLSSLNKVIRSRQFMRRAFVYFDDDGNAFLLPKETGLKLD